MIRIKLTPAGGYVVGDGPCPFDPDRFLALFQARMMRAMAEGNDEIIVDDDEIERIIRATPTVEVPDGLNAEALIDELPL